MKDLQRMKLSGTWSFRLDSEDKGLTDKWYETGGDFDVPVNVPGAWQAQGIGDHKPHPVPQSSMPPVEMERASYHGTGWYRRTFSVPDEWDGKHIWLVMGGTHPVSTIWIDGHEVGTHVGSTLEYRFNVTPYVRPGGRHNLTVRISEYPGEEEQRNYRNPLTGTFFNWCVIWSGIYRDVFLEATRSLRIANVSIFPDLGNGSARLNVDLTEAGKNQHSNLKLKVLLTEPDGTEAGQSQTAFNMGDQRHTERVDVSLNSIRPWSPDTPFLYHAKVWIEDADGMTVDTCSERFGMREFAVKNDKILLNGQPIWLRGFGDHFMYPLTLHPPIDRKQIEKELKRAREYGFNFVLHYVMPNREYLDVADEVGLLVQGCPLLTSARGGDSETYMQPWYLEHAVKQTINHPSVMSYSFTGEVYFHSAESSFIRELNEIVRRVRGLDPSRLINACAGVDRASAHRDDTDILEMAMGIGCNPCELDVFTTPVILHEYRWWSSYPNPELKPKYANAGMRPFFLDHAERVAEEKGFAHLLPVFVENSAKLQALERKIGLEKGRRARGVCGYELYLGKDTGWAAEGLWDDFGDPKNVPAEEFLETNGDTVLLIDKDYYYRNYWSGEKIPVELWLSHFGHAPVTDGVIRWTLTSRAGDVLARGEEAVPHFPCYTTERVCRLDIRPREVQSSVTATLQVTLEADSGTVTNHWNFWLFARDLAAKPGGRVAAVGIPTLNYDLDFAEKTASSQALEGFDLVVTNTLNRHLIRYLQQGGKALLIAQGVFPELFCEFKSNLYNGCAEGNSGTLIREHPAMGSFPHEGWCDLQFYGLLEDAPVINLDEWPVYVEPIIRSINNYQKGIHRAYLCEARVGEGALLTTTLNFRGLRGIGRYYCEVENTYLLDQLIKYGMSADFEPEADLPVSFLEKMAGLDKPVDTVTARENQNIVGNEGLV